MICMYANSHIPQNERGTLQAQSVTAGDVISIVQVSYTTGQWLQFSNPEDCSLMLQLKWLELYLINYSTADPQK